jgi:hypothetical protein
MGPLAIVAQVVSLASSLLTSGCGEKFDGPPEIIPAQLVFDANTGGASLLPILDGDTVQLVPPIQGGYVLFIGAVGRNLSMRSASLLGELRRSVADDGTALSEPGRVLVSDERSVRVVKITPVDGIFDQAAEADPNEVSNIPTCPNPLDVDIVDNSLFLVMTYKDGQGRSASAVRTVVPRCTQTDTEVRKSCICQCLAGYTTNRCFNPADASTDGSADAL